LIQYDLVAHDGATLFLLFAWSSRLKKYYEDRAHSQTKEPDTNHKLYRNSNLDSAMSGQTTKSLAHELAPRRQIDTQVPRTFQEYLDKYYGIVEKRDGMVQELSDEDPSHLSDSGVDYAQK